MLGQPLKVSASSDAIVCFFNALIILLTSIFILFKVAHCPTIEQFFAGTSSTLQEYCRTMGDVLLTPDSITMLVIIFSLSPYYIKMPDKFFVPFSDCPIKLADLKRKLAHFQTGNSTYKSYSQPTSIGRTINKEKLIWIKTQHGTH